jgi:hypothetical protein
MKKTILTMAIMTMAVTLSMSYGQEPDKKSVKARENLKEERKDVVEAKKDLKEAQKDSASEYQKFKTESELKIKNNEKRLAELKVKQAKMNEKDRAIYLKKVNKLEQKNADLKMKLTNYKNNEGQTKWMSFKTEFNHDMNELGRALKDFTVDNKK